MTTVTFTPTSCTAINHAGNTGLCIAVSVAVQTVARVLNEQGLLAEVTLDREPPMFRFEIATVDPELQARGHAALLALESVMREIQQMDPSLLEITGRN